MITRFVGECQRRERKGCRFLMITGAPGLGKTLAVTTVLKTARCMVIALNSNVTKTLREVQEIIYERILGRKSSKSLNTQQMIRELVAEGQTQPILVYVEEIETALSGFQNDYTYEFLSLFSRKELNLSLIGVSNSIDALERYSEKVASLHQAKNLVFAPYNQHIIAAIILDRFHELSQRCQINIEVSEKLMRYVARKLENLTKGDLRMVNEFTKEVVAAVIHEQDLPESGQEECKQDIRYSIQIGTLDRIFRKIENSKQDLIQSLPFTQQLLLIGINSIIENEELLYVAEERIMAGMGKACEVVGLSSNRQKIKEWLRELECYSLIRIEERKERETRVTLKVNSK